MTDLQPGIDPDIERLFLKHDADIVARRNFPVREHLLARTRLIVDDLKPQIEAILECKVEWKQHQDAGSYGSLQAIERLPPYERRRVVLSYAFSSRGEMVATFVDPQWADAPGADRLERVDRLLASEGFVPFPYEQALYPYTGDMRAFNGELLRERAGGRYRDYHAWADIFFDWL